MSLVKQQTVLFNVEPIVTELSLKYGVFYPYTPRQLAVFSEYFKEALFRVFGLNTLPLDDTGSEFIYIYGNWYSNELSLIHDSSFDNVLTQTILFDMMSAINRTLYFTCKLSVNMLILEGY